MLFKFKNNQNELKSEWMRDRMGLQGNDRNDGNANNLFNYQLMQSFQCIESIPAFSHQYQTPCLYLNIWLVCRIARIKNTGKYFAVFLFAFLLWNLLWKCVYQLIMRFDSVWDAFVVRAPFPDVWISRFWIYSADIRAYDKDAVLVIEN